MPDVIGYSSNLRKNKLERLVFDSCLFQILSGPVTVGIGIFLLSYSLNPFLGSLLLFIPTLVAVTLSIVAISSATQEVSPGRGKRITTLVCYCLLCVPISFCIALFYLRMFI